MNHSTHIHTSHSLCGVQIHANLHHKSQTQQQPVPHCHLNSYHPRKGVGKKHAKRRAENDSSQIQNSHELEKRGNSYIYIYKQRSKATQLQIWTKITNPKGITWSNQWLHMKKLQPAMAPPSLPPLHKATPHVLQVQKHVPAFDAFRKNTGTNMPRFWYHQMNQTSRMRIQESVAPTRHVLGTRWTKGAECADRNH